MNKMVQPDFWDNLFDERWVETAKFHSAGSVLRDGKIAEYAVCRVPVLTVESSAFMLKEFGTTASGMVFILPGGIVEPKIGDRIEYRGRRFDLKTVQVCKTIRGTAMAYRCAAV